MNCKSLVLWLLPCSLTLDVIRLSFQHFWPYFLGVGQGGPGARSDFRSKAGARSAKGKKEVGARSDSRISWSEERRNQKWGSEPGAPRSKRVEARSAFYHCHPPPPSLINPGGMESEKGRISPLVSHRIWKNIPVLWHSHGVSRNIESWRIKASENVLFIAGNRF